MNNQGILNSTALSLLEGKISSISGAIDIEMSQWHEGLAIGMCLALYYMDRITDEQKTVLNDIFVSTGMKRRAELRREH